MNSHLPAGHTTQIDVAPARAGKRIAAYLINVILTLLAYAPLLIAIVVWPSNSYIERTQGLEALAASDWLMPGLLIGFLVLLAYIIIQVRMMSKTRPVDRQKNHAHPPAQNRRHQPGLLGRGDAA